MGGAIVADRMAVEAMAALLVVLVVLKIQLMLIRIMAERLVMVGGIMKATGYHFLKVGKI